MSLDIDLIVDGESVYEANITHNLTVMAKQAGCYGVLWRPHDNGIHKASDLAEFIGPALLLMVTNPEFYEKYDSENGWGTYKSFVPWLTDLLIACSRFPDANVRVCVFSFSRCKC